MLKKSLASALSAALLITAVPGTAVQAFAANMQTGRAGAIPSVKLGAPIAAPTALPTLNVTGIQALPSAAVALPNVQAPAAAAAAQAAAPAAAAANVTAALQVAGEAKAAPETRSAALGTIYEGSRLGSAVSGPAVDATAASESAPSALSAPASRSSSKAAAAVERRSDGGSVIGVAVGAAAVVGALALISKPFRALVQRAWNATLGMLGIGVKKMETPEVLAQRIIDQLNAAKPVYNRKVQEASTMVEKLRLQISSEKAKVQDLETGITAILSDSDPNNDIMAAGMINQQKILNASIAASTEQLGLAQKTLEGIKEERARFFAEREEMIAKINAKLTEKKAADIKKQIAELKGGFQIGDLKDNMDRFEDAVNDTIADAKGAEDSVNSNPDEILKKAKDQLRDKEVQDEIARRKKEIADKAAGNGKTGGKLGRVDFLFFGAMGSLLGWTLAAHLAAYWPVMAVVGLAAFTMWATTRPWNKPAHDLATHEHRAVAVGLIGYAMFAGVTGVFALPALVAAGIALAASFWHAKRDGTRKSDGGSVIMIAGAVAAVIAILAAVSKPFRDLVARAWNATLGMLGIGVKKMETPEVMAQRIIDQLNAAKPVYNRKVQDASTLVEKLRLQIKGQEEKSAELDRSITAILSDSDPNNDVMAGTLIKQKQVIDASTVSTKEQVAIAEKTLESIKEERARFFAEREEMIAKINAKLTEKKAADIKKQIAELKGGFQIGDLKDNMDRFEDAVNDTIADAKGAEDSVDSNPDEILKKAKDELRNKEVLDEIARRKKEIADKNSGNGGAGARVLPGFWGFLDAVATVAMALYAGTHTGWLSALVGMTALLPGLGIIGGIVGGVFAEKVLKTSGAKTMGGMIVGGLVGWLGGLIAGFMIGFYAVSPVTAGVFAATALLTVGVERLFKTKNIKPTITKPGDDGKSDGGSVDSRALGYFAKAIGVGFALYAPFLSAVVFAVMGLIALIMQPAQGQWLGRQLAVIGAGTLLIGGGAMVVGAKLGLAIGAFGSGIGFVVPAGLALAAGLLAAWRAHKTSEAIGSQVTVPTSAPSATPAPVVTAPAETAPAASKGASFSLKPLGDLIKRFWNALLGIFGLGVKKMETPEVLAQRMIDQLNAAKPAFNQKVRDASALVEKLKLQIGKQEQTSAELDKAITAMLSDSDPSNDVMAATMIKQKQTLDASTASTKEQLAIAEKGLEAIKEERARFFAEREEALAKIQAGLTKAKAAEIKKQISELKGGFEIGDLKDNMGRFEDAVNDRVADAKGAEDAVNSNPDEILKKAKDELRGKEVQDELARRREEIARRKSGK